MTSHPSQDHSALEEKVSRQYLKTPRKDDKLRMQQQERSLALLYTYQSGGIDRQYEGMSTVTLVIEDTLTQHPIGLELSGFEQLWRVRLLEISLRKSIEP